MSSLVVVHFEVETLNICIQFITHRFLEGDFDTYTVQMRKPQYEEENLDFSCPHMFYS